MQTFIARRLDHYGGTFAHLLKAIRCQLPAGIAVDTGRIDKKVALDICIETLFWIRHCMNPRSPEPFASASPIPPPGHTMVSGPTFNLRKMREAGDEWTTGSPHERR